MKKTSEKLNRQKPTKFLIKEDFKGLKPLSMLFRDLVVSELRKKD